MNARTVSQKGLIALAVSEGVVVNPYLDNATPPVWTVGIGHTAGAGAPYPEQNIGKTYSIPEIMTIFERDVQMFTNGVLQATKVSLLQHELDACVHFAFNIGMPGYRRSKLLTNLNAGNKQQAFQTGFHGWLKPASLRGRRDKERAMALHGQYGSTVAPRYTANTAGKLTRAGTVDIAKELRSRTPIDAPTPTPRPSQPQSVGLLTRFLRWIGWYK